MPDLRDTSNFCARYSVIGMLFMVMVSMMLTYQPFFIGGIEDLEQARSNAYGGAGTFLCIFVLSVVYLVFDALRGGGNNNARRESRRSRGHEYDSVATSGIDGPDFMMDHLELPPSVEQARFT